MSCTIDDDFPFMYKTQSSIPYVQPQYVLVPHTRFTLNENGERIPRTFFVWTMPPFPLYDRPPTDTFPHPYHWFPRILPGAKTTAATAAQLHKVRWDTIHYGPRVINHGMSAIPGTPGLWTPRGNERPVVMTGDFPPPVAKSVKKLEEFLKGEAKLVGKRT